MFNHSFFEAVNQSHNLVPNQLLLLQVSILVKAVEALSLELVSNLHIYTWNEISVDFAIGKDLNGIGVQMCNMVFILIWFFYIE